MIFGLQLILGLGSILVAELTRDLLHLLAHYWQPLQKSHTLHHKVYRPDLTMVSLEAYRQSQWRNDVPESLVMMVVTGIVALVGNYYGLWAGYFYAMVFLVSAVARSQGWLLQTDFSHKPGDLVELPAQWYINRTYHWRHHFDQGNAYYCGTLPILDKVLGTCLSLKGKVVAVTGASGAMGQALIQELSRKGARVVALTTSDPGSFDSSVEVLTWQLGSESAVVDRLQKVDILILNHGVNVAGDRSPGAIQKCFEVNTFSVWRWMELFISTVNQSSHLALKEVWINTSEAEVSPAFSPLYEMSKRTIGDLITLRRLDAPCVIRKLILGPFKSQLNPIGIMSPRWVAWAVIALAQRDFRNIIVTINPLTYVAFPIKELGKSLYFRLFSQR